jgi:uncharacterized protein YggE
MMMARAASPDAGAATPALPVEPGVILLEANVRVVWEVRN